jgi:hypothetical protein
MKADIYIEWHNGNSIPVLNIRDFQGINHQKEKHIIETPKGTYFSKTAPFDAYMCMGAQFELCVIPIRTEKLL